MRVELEESLKRKGQVKVIPVLVSRASLPTADELPPALSGLAYRNAAQARPDPDFANDMQRLIEQLERYFGTLASATPPTPAPTKLQTIARKPPNSAKPEPANPTFEFEVVTITGVEKGLLGLGQPKVTTVRRRAKADYFVETLAAGVSLEMVKITAGQFLMGSPDSEEDRRDSEGPQHSVTVPEFWLGKYPVTQAQYQAVIGKKLSGFSENGANRPVEQVSWHDAIAFCEKLSQQTGRTYRLPSEAEWEYACRAGTTTPFHFGPTLMPDLANYCGEYTYSNGPKGVYRAQTTNVGGFSPNAFGLYDMHGNIWEWCADHWHDNYDGASIDGSAWLSDGKTSLRVRRGGSWGYGPQSCRSAFRDVVNPDGRNSDNGFRVCCSIHRT